MGNHLLVLQPTDEGAQLAHADGDVTAGALAVAAVGLGERRIARPELMLAQQVAVQAVGRQPDAPLGQERAEAVEAPAGVANGVGREVAGPLLSQVAVGQLLEGRRGDVLAIRSINRDKNRSDGAMEGGSCLLPAGQRRAGLPLGSGRDVAFGGSDNTGWP